MANKKKKSFVESQPEGPLNDTFFKYIPDAMQMSNYLKQFMSKELIFLTSSFFLQVANTCQPFCDKYFAVSRPIPEEQPVIKILFFLSFI